MSLYGHDFTLILISLCWCCSIVFQRPHGHINKLIFMYRMVSRSVLLTTLVSGTVSSLSCSRCPFSVVFCHSSGQSNFCWCKECNYTLLEWLWSQNVHYLPETEIKSCFGCRFNNYAIAGPQLASKNTNISPIKILQAEQPLISLCVSSQVITLL